MARVSESARLYAPAERVWEAIGEFGSIADWHPAVLSCELGSQGTHTVRTLDVGADDPVVERLDVHDPRAMRYTYTLEDGPLPVRDYRAALSVHRDDANSCTVEWNSEFQPTTDDPGEAVEAIRDIYRKGLEHLRFTLGA